MADASTAAVAELVTYSTDACPACPDGGQSRSPIHLHMLPPGRAVPRSFTQEEIIQSVREYEAERPDSLNLCGEHHLIAVCLACQARPTLTIGGSYGSPRCGPTHHAGCAVADRA